MKFKGKAIYNPSGKAGEYTYWACNLYCGCSNGCTYCYLKKGILAKHLGSDKPTLKKCFRDEQHALQLFNKELRQNLEEIKKHGLFFSFTTDPMIEETKDMTLRAIYICNKLKVPVKILTKEVLYIYQIHHHCDFDLDTSIIAIGFTLTGHDELEKNASINLARITCIEMCKIAGFKTFASIEPIIDFESSKRMIEMALPYCDLFKIGLESGKKYDVTEAQTFVEWLSELPNETKIYMKESLQKLTHYTNEEMGFVERDYNLFN